MRRKKLYVKLLGTLVITGVSCANLVVVSAETTDSKEANRTVTSQSLSKLEKKKEFVLTPEVTDTDITAVIGEEGQLTMNAPDFGKEIELEDITTITVKDSEILSIDAAGKWKALKAGETQVEVAFVFTDEDMEKLKELYPDEELLILEQAQVLDVKITEKVLDTVDITPVFDISKITAKVNDSGQIAVAPMGGVTEIKGTFKAYGHDESVIQVTESGKWTALAAGKTTFSLAFELSEETIKEIEEKNPGKELLAKTIIQVIEVEVTPEKQIQIIDPNTGLATKTITAVVGDTGKLIANPIEGIENLNGSFYPALDTSDIITVDEQGNWTAQKAGTTTLLIAHMPSNETIAAIEATYPEGTEVAYPSILVYEKIEVTITAPADTKPSGTDTTQSPTKELPKTGSEDGLIQASLGVMTTAIAAGAWVVRKKRIEE